MKFRVDFVFAILLRIEIDLAFSNDFKLYDLIPQGNTITLRHN